MDNKKNYGPYMDPSGVMYNSQKGEDGFPCVNKEHIMDGDQSKSMVNKGRTGGKGSAGKYPK